MFCSVERQNSIHGNSDRKSWGYTRSDLPSYSSVLKAIADVDRAYSPKLAQQFLWESSMESVLKKEWSHTHTTGISHMLIWEARGDASKHGADFSH